MFDSWERLRKDVRQLIVRIGVDDFDNLLRERIAYSVVPNVDVLGALVDSLRLNQGPGALIIDMERDRSRFEIRLRSQNFRQELA